MLHLFRCRGMWLWCASILLAGLALPDRALATITLSEDFDGASLNTNASSASGSTVTLVPRYTAPLSSYGPTWWWSLAFRADGVQGLTVQFRLPAPLADLESQDRFVYSYDNVNWQYFDNGAVNGSEYDFSNNSPFTQNTVYVAIMFPYPTSKTDAFVASVKSNPYVQPTASSDANLMIGHTPGTAGGDSNGLHYLDDMGRTVPSLPIYGFQVTDSNASGTKTKMVVQAGNHSGEPLSGYVLEGLVDWLVGTSPQAAALARRRCFISIPVPIRKAGTAAFMSARR